MHCPNCHASIPDDSQSCPHCGQPVIHVREVVDAEIVDHPRSEQRGGGFHQRVVFMQSNGNQILPSCQMSIITLALAFAMGLKFGLLACIGFLVFAGIARILTFAINLQLAMMGRSINPLVLQIFSWFCCWSLVAWLAS
ncbi:zinc-ribbon domain-containing protein [Mailhella sp.]|uniref:zinc-ribbon domain-containing protein n=1 Tax=Mailhella sp. TaxID=1981029 RepID=UPI003AB34B85